MTIEEAKNILINRGFVEINGDQVFDGNKWRNAIAVISKWLENQPCENYISRQAVKDIICSGVSIDTDVDKEYVCELIDKLPSVTPKEKTGHWESTEIFYGGESKGAIIKCSECGNEFKVSPKVFENLYGNERFCNYCGVRMVNE